MKQHVADKQEIPEMEAQDSGLTGLNADLIFLTVETFYPIHRDFSASDLHYIKYERL
jgi:hypothetical protein